MVLTLTEAVLTSHSHIVGERGHMVPTHCPDWHGRQTVFWGRNDGIQHMHTWLLHCLELTYILCWGLSKTKDCPFWQLHSQSSPYGSKWSNVLLTLETWLQYKYHRVMHETGTTSTDENNWDPPSMLAEMMGRRTFEGKGWSGAFGQKGQKPKYDLESLRNF